MAPGGARPVIAESVLLNPQLIVLNRSRRKAPPLRALDRRYPAVAIIAEYPGYAARIVGVCMRLMAVGILAGLQGCIALPIPHDQPYSPELTGTVLDADTKQPIAGAKVHMEGSVVEPPLETEVLTAPDGSFTVRVHKRELWMPLWLGPPRGSASALPSQVHLATLQRKISLQNLAQLQARELALDTRSRGKSFCARKDDPSVVVRKNWIGGL